MTKVNDTSDISKLFQFFSSQEDNSSEFVLFIAVQTTADRNSTRGISDRCRNL